MRKNLPGQLRSIASATAVVLLVSILAACSGGGGDGGDGEAADNPAAGEGGGNGGGNNGGGGGSGNPTGPQPINDPPHPSPDRAQIRAVSSGTVALQLNLPQAMQNYPLKSGIPFPYGSVPELRNLQLQASNGSAVAAQFDRLASWPDGSVKAALVQTHGNFQAGRSNFRLNYGSQISAGSSNANPISIVNTSSEVSVDTGLVRLQLNSGTGLASAVHRDSNNNGQYSAAEQTLGAARIFLTSLLDDRAYSAGSNASITVEESGPVRAVIKVEGELVNGSRQHSKYLLRYYLYAESDLLDVELTLIDDRLEYVFGNDDNEGFAIALRDYGLAWALPNANGNRYRFGGDGNTVHAGAVSGEHHLVQTGLMTHLDGLMQGYDFDYSGAGTGNRAPGWLAVDNAGNNTHINLFFRKFWEQFPAELAVTRDELRVSFMPGRLNYRDTEQLTQQSGTAYRRARGFYFEGEGGAKTYQLRLQLSSAQVSDARVRSANELFQQAAMPLMAERNWYLRSQVFGDLSAGTSPDANSGYDAFLKQFIYQPSTNSPNSILHLYGWRDYGDRMKDGWEGVFNDVRVPGFYNDTHTGSNGYFREYLRTGDEIWYEMAEKATRHFMDIDVSHGPRYGNWFTPTPSEQQPAGEMHLLSHGNLDHETSRLHTGHAHISGITDYYLLSGDKRALEVLHEIGGWWEYMTPYLFSLPFVFDDQAPGGQYRESERDFGWPLYVMNEYVRVTGDKDYHRRVSANLVQYMIDWWKSPAQRIGVNLNDLSYGPQGTNDASRGTGWWTMTEMDNDGGIVGANGTNPWMAGSLLGNLIHFYKLDQEFAAMQENSFIDHADLKDMLFQTMNYVVKYGWSDELDRFVYSETRRTYPGGSDHIVYPLAYLYKLYGSENAANRLRNPQWYDTVEDWKIIAEKRHRFYTQDQYASTTIQAGFFGYELVFPLDYFKLMEEGL